MTDPPAFYSVLFDLGTVRDQPTEMVLEPTEQERSAISSWLGTEALATFRAHIQISREGEDLYGYAARFEADVVQACVVTLEPCPAHLSGEFRRRFRRLPKRALRRRQAAAGPAIDLAAADEDEPELLDEPVIDLAAPVLEELTLALDPYPRAPGVAFAAPHENVTPPESPFAVLEKLKTAGPEHARTEKASLRHSAKSSDKKGP